MPDQGVDKSLANGWALTVLAPGTASHPLELGVVSCCWTPASIPGTAAQSLRADGQWNGRDDLTLNERDVWYRGAVALAGPHRLRFDGLATIATIWLDDDEILSSSNMFLPAECDVTLKAGQTIWILFRSVTASLQGVRDRARWRPRMITPPALRRVRTSLTGHMPDWQPSIQTVGPWRTIVATPLDEQPRLLSHRMRADWSPGGAGIVRATLTFTRPIQATATLRIGDVVTTLPTGKADLDIEIQIRDPKPWFPHTHGEPFLYAGSLQLGAETIALPAIGFREIRLDRGADGRGFRIIVNGTPVFCRGANWITADIAAAGNNIAALDQSLQRAKDASFNMLRVPGVAAYENDAFYQRCDALGIMVWQDCAFANFDYPADEAFLASARAEIDAFLHRTSASPCLTVVCGGSEIAQQAAMLGAPPSAWAHKLFDDIIPGALAAQRPDVVHAPHSPFGAALPFMPDGGVTHYYGVGAYQRPLPDGRSARVRFASECLAFANPPDDEVIDHDIGARSVHHPDWKRGVPRDAGAGWDFDDVRDFYLRELTGYDPARLRYDDNDGYLELSRAVLATLFERMMDAWRADGINAGALIWTFQDTRPGAGWGLLDWRGKPKSVWHALRRACRPVRLAVTDDGLNGLGLHLINDTDAPIAGELSLNCLNDEGVSLTRGARPVVAPPRSVAAFSSADILSGFFDVTHAYRFGPCAHQACVAQWSAPDGTLLAENIFLPGPISLMATKADLTAELIQHETGWRLKLRSSRFAQFVRIDDKGLQPSDSWFHMRPGQDYLIQLDGDPTLKPNGSVNAFNGAMSVRYQA